MSLTRYAENLVTQYQYLPQHERHCCRHTASRLGMARARATPSTRERQRKRRGAGAADSANVQPVTLLYRRRVCC